MSVSETSHNTVHERGRDRTKRISITYRIQMQTDRNILGAGVLDAMQAKLIAHICDLIRLIHRAALNARGVLNGARACMLRRLTGRRSHQIAADLLF